jgi:WD40 repeat protein
MPSFFNRTVVSNYETGKLSKSPDKKDIQKPPPIFSPEDDELLSNPSPSRKSQIKKALSEKKIKPIPQVTLDPSSIDYISKLINDKITRELAARDRRILEQVHEIVQQSLSQLRIEDHAPPQKSHPVPPQNYDPNRDSDNKSISSAQSNRSNQNPNPSKIPRIRLPKVNNVYDNRKANSPRNYENTPLSAGGNNNNQLPAIKSKASLKNNQFKDEYISVEGIQYPQCRSVVYPSTTDIDLLKTRHLRKVPKLSLRHILGYDGDPSRHGGGLRGKNVIWLNQREIAFPAAAIVVVIDVHTEKQKFFLNHSDDVISLAAFPPMSVIASSQIGNDCSILIWNYRDLNSNDVIPCQQLLPPTNLRGINNLCFSPDGKLLLACGIEDSRMVYIFDWQKNILLTSAKTGHSDYCQFAFNPFCYEPFDEENNLNQRGSMKKVGNQANKDNNNTPELTGCYAITSISGKILKFWTIKQQIAIPTAKQRSEKKPKQAQTIQYILEGTQGQMKKSNINAFDFTSYTFIGHDAHLNYVLVGLSNGSLQVWQHQVDAHSRNHQHLSWLARGKLVLVIADVHEGPIMEMDFVYHESKLITGDGSGILNIWNVHLTDKITEGLPLEHIGAVQLDNTSARSLHWNHDGLSVAIGATNNSISILKLNPLTNQEGLTEFDLQALLIAHNGKVRKLAVHPLQDNFFATICSDSSIRIWDSDVQCHVSCIFIESQPTAISFSADGIYLTIGNEKGEFIILYSREFEALLTQSKHNVQNYINFQWKVVDTKSFSTSSKMRFLLFCIIILNPFPSPSPSLLLSLYRFQ